MNNIILFVALIVQSVDGEFFSPQLDSNIGDYENCARACSQKIR